MMQIPLFILKNYISPSKVLANGIYGLFITIDGLLYRLISYLFSLFFSLAGAELFDNSVYQAIADRVYLFVGVIALFTISASLLKSLVDPDNLSKGVIKSFKSLVISIVLIVLTPSLFTYAFKIQNAILTDNIIGKIFQIDLSKYRETGNSSTATTSDIDSYCSTSDTIHVDVNDDSGETISKDFEISKNKCEGNYIAYTVFSAFFKPESDSVTNEFKTTWGEAKKYIIYTGDFTYAKTYVSNLVEPEATNTIEYSIVICTLVSLPLIYMIFSFCLDLGVRAAKLAFYQLISPIPILFRIIPGKEGQFDKWLKQTMSCFFEVFVRVTLIEFVVFFASNLFDLIDSLNWGDTSLIGKVIIVLGLFTFAKQAPKLLKDALGLEGGNLKLGIKGKLTDTPVLGKGFSAAYGLGNKAKGAVTGAIGAGYASMTNGGKFSTGAKYGAANGFSKGGSQFNNQRKGLYSELGFKGSPGMFGGQKLAERYSEDAKSSASKAMGQEINKWIENYERTNPNFLNAKNDNMTKIKAEQQEKYNKAKSEYDREVLPYVQEESRIRAEQEKSRVAYENAQNDIARLKNTLKTNGWYEGEDYISLSSEQREQINKNINKLSQITHDNSKFEGMISQNNIRKENDSQLDGLKSTMSSALDYVNNVDSALDKAAGAAARTQMMVEDASYGSKVEASNKIEKRDQVKKQMNSVESQANMEAMKKVMEAINKDKK